MARDRSDKKRMTGLPDRWSIEREVRERAYERYIERMSTGEEGDDFRDWVAAEAEVLESRAKTGH